MTSRFIGSGYVVYFVVALAEIRSDVAIVAGWWTLLAVALAFGPGWLLLAATYVPQVAVVVVQRLAMACGIGYLCALGLWFAAWNGAQVDGPRGTWLVLFPGLASLAVVLTRYPWLALGHLVIAVPLVQLASALGRSNRYGHAAVLGDLAWAGMFCAVFVLAGIMAVRTGDVLDAERDRVAALAGRAAADQARQAERAWYDRLIHDRVLMVLQHVRGDVEQPHLVPYARQALAELGTTRGDLVVSGGLAPHIRAVAAAIDARIVVIEDRSTATAVVVPPAVVRDLGDAAAEAMRNALRHGGTDVAIVVRIETSTEAVCVRIVDDGPGFDIATVGKDRLGVTQSIIARTEAIEGHVAITGVKAGGTQVVLRWPTS